METNNKPDFEKIAREYAETFKTGEWFENIRTDAGRVIGEKIWNDYVMPERKHNAEMQTIRIEWRDNAINKINRLESENQALKSELDKAKGKINVLVEIIANEISKG